MAYKKFKTLDDFIFKGKNVLLRVDINSEVKNGKIRVSGRIREHAKTIKELKKKNARVIILAHQGRPGSEDFIDLKQHAAALRRFTNVKFVPDVCGKRALNAIDSLRDGEAILLDNVRKIKDEFFFDRNSRYIRELTKRSDIYINDAFSISHRKQASIMVFPKLLPSGIGRVLEEELKNINKIHLKDTLFILGGAKIEDNMLLIKKKNILSTGVFSLVCLIANGNSLGVENKILSKYRNFMIEIKKNISNIKTPIDLAFEVRGKREEHDISELPLNERALDIGSKTVEEYSKRIMNARQIFWKGPAGYYENKKFLKGTKELLKSMEKSGAFCVIAGGHSESILERLNINRKKLGYVSLSGGALLHYIAGEKLPGLEALKIKARKN
ncbi:phosphoglycerate kinase [Candidatus Pacearchaeota archaeon CG10_big_fil_rev_8_21_14_0_10_34_76]|nr:MAG: phosphoglycerate kinase [Candidatus Pacearchaeota archaeon CG10_big_fil_rev_8_21_14_0_10_34_76]